MNSLNTNEIRANLSSLESLTLQIEQWNKREEIHTNNAATTKLLLQKVEEIDPDNYALLLEKSNDQLTVNIFERERNGLPTGEHFIDIRIGDYLHILLKGSAFTNEDNNTDFEGLETLVEIGNSLHCPDPDIQDDIKWAITEQDMELDFLPKVLNKQLNLCSTPDEVEIGELSFSLLKHLSKPQSLADDPQTTLTAKIESVVESHFVTGAIPPAVHESISELSSLASSLQSRDIDDYRFYELRATINQGDDETAISYFAHTSTETQLGDNEQIVEMVLASNTRFKPGEDVVNEEGWWMSCDKLLDDIELVEIDAAKYLAENPSYQTNTASRLHANQYRP
ncbi:hypothetical protein [Vibrio owensii]|uniref:hypothetical protein n=1 Tax=Vibrio owensii TaxID=696485 RepID=UPI0018F19635|nr:hypothetical protein [Vibrio owensii]